MNGLIPDPCLEFLDDLIARTVADLDGLKQIRKRVIANRADYVPPPGEAPAITPLKMDGPTIDAVLTVLGGGPATTGDLHRVIGGSRIAIINAIQRHRGWFNRTGPKHASFWSLNELGRAAAGKPTGEAA